MPNKRVIDLSHHNVIPVSLQATAAAGVWGVIHKATEGGTFKDSKASARWFLTKEAGMLWGLYHFLRPAFVASISKQIDNFMSVWINAADEDSLIALDWEKNINDSRPPNIEEALEWLEGIENKTGRRPVIYSGNVLKEAVGSNRHPILNEDFFLLWLAQYSATPKLPIGWSKYWLWQWTDTGSISGVEPPTDLNDFQGSHDSLITVWTGADDIPVPDEKVIIDITVPNSVSVQIKFNGVTLTDS